MKRSNKFYLLIVILSLFLASCGGSSGSGDNNQEAISAQACQSLTLASSTAAPLSNLLVTDLSETLNQRVQNENLALYASFKAIADTDALPLITPLVPVQNNNGFSLQIRTPFNPDSPYSPSEHQVKLVFGDLTCDLPETVAVNALTPAAPEVVDTIVDRLQEWILQRSSASGYSDWNELLTLRDSYLNDEVSLSGNLLLSAMIADDLEKLLNQLSTLTSEEKTLLATILETSGYGDSLQSHLDSMTQGYTQQNSVSSTSVNRQASVNIQSSGACATIAGGPVEINDAGDLDYYMRLQASAQETLQGVGGSAREAALATTPLLGLVSGGAAAGVGFMLFVEYTLMQYDAKTLPGLFEELEVDLNPGNEVNEDYELTGQTVSWSNARIRASSEGWNLTGVGLDLISQGIGLGRYMKALTTGGSNALAGLLVDQAQNEVFNKAKGLTPEIECLEVATHTWGPIDISAPEWSEDETDAGAALSLGARTNTYRILELRKIGLGEVIVRTAPGKFGERNEVWNDFIEIKRITLTATPSHQKVDNPGETKTFSIQVENSSMPETLLQQGLNTSSGVSIANGPDHLGNGLFNVTLNTPVSAAQYPANLELFREPILDPYDRRSGTLYLISNEEIELTPAEGCIRKGDELLFRAELLGFAEGTTVQWQLLQGSGTLTPLPDSGGTRQATFSSVNEGSAVVQVSAQGVDDTIIDTANINVGTCDAKVHVSGQFSVQAAAGGERDEYELPEDFLPFAPDMPQRPASFWQGRTEHVGDAVNASGTHEFGVGQDLITLNQLATGSGYATYSVDGSGQTSFKVDFEGSDECDPHPVGDTSQVECSDVDLAAGITAHYYSDLTQSTTYRVSLSVDCSRTGDTWGSGTLVSAQLVRFDESGAPAIVNYDPDTGTIGEYPSGMILDGGELPVFCATGSAPYVFTDDFEVLGPPEGETHELIMIFSFITLAASNHYAGMDLSDADPMNPPPLPDQKSPGNYTGTMELNATFNFYPISP